MSSKDRDLYILKKIIEYCNDADDMISRFSISIEGLKSETIYKNATSMCVLQIGELVGHLSEGIKAKYIEVPWKQIRGMRNIAVHGYEKFDIDELWKTLNDDLPALREYCNKIIIAES